MEPSVQITEYTDPACPWAYSAEPFRHRISWLYEGHVRWEPRMVVLAKDAAAQAERGMTPEKLAAASARIAHEHGMPIDTRQRARVPGTREACLAVVAARTHADRETTRKLLRRLRIRYFSGELLDDAATIHAAAADAGIEDEIDGWM